MNSYACKTEEPNRIHRKCSTPSSSHHDLPYQKEHTTPSLPNFLLPNPSTSPNPPTIMHQHPLHRQTHHDLQPPINLWDANLVTSFNTFLNTLQAPDGTTKVVVFTSNNPDFWASTLDFNLFTQLGIPGRNGSSLLDTYFANLDLLLTTPVIFIGESRGAGDEHLLRMDMRFVGPEAAIGVLHVGSIQQLVRLIGLSLASEYLLAAAQVSASEAARVGWVNSVHPSAEASRKHVDETLRLTKASIAEQAPPRRAFEYDLRRFNGLAGLPVVAANLEAVLRLSRNESRGFEEDLNGDIVRKLYRTAR
ncbi:hypothetical protein CCMA1212_006450 [Trichoderma ghanense]|uniref:Enoyl-CoA hydratase/isomerase n=1 Tax=Trichoderma ghanense TaxID=65468 RepID=A0ABY2H3W4_9HYPO